jgi:hypothetical protein
VAPELSIDLGMTYAWIAVVPSRGGIENRSTAGLAKVSDASSVGGWRFDNNTQHGSSGVVAPGYVSLDSSNMESVHRVTISTVDMLGVNQSSFVGGLSNLSLVMENAKGELVVLKLSQGNCSAATLSCTFVAEVVYGYAGSVGEVFGPGSVVYLRGGDAAGSLPCAIGMNYTNSSRTMCQASGATVCSGLTGVVPSYYNSSCSALPLCAAFYGACKRGGELHIPATSRAAHRRGQHGRRC